MVHMSGCDVGLLCVTGSVRGVAGEVRQCGEGQQYWLLDESLLVMTIRDTNMLQEFEAHGYRRRKI